MGHLPRVPRQGRGKKLVEVAQTWVRRGLKTDKEHPLLADARAMGAGARQLEALRARIEAEDGSGDVLGVWSVHWHAFLVFQGMADQWRVVVVEGRLMRLGLDYAALPPVLDAHRRLPRRLRQRPRALLRQLRVLTVAAREAFEAA